MPKTIAYARVSTADQSLDLQRDALAKAGYNRLFEDHGRSGVAKRPELERALTILEPRDTLLVWRFDRLGRSIRELVDIIDDLHRRDIGFISLTEHIDLNNAVGRLILHIMGSFAEFERQLIRERTIAGLEAARSRGVRIGRPQSVCPTKLIRASALIDEGVSVSNAAASLGIARSSLYRHLSAFQGTDK